MKYKIIGGKTNSKMSGKFGISGKLKSRQFLWEDNPEHQVGFSHPSGLWNNSPISGDHLQYQSLITGEKGASGIPLYSKVEFRFSVLLMLTPAPASLPQCGRYP